MKKGEKRRVSIKKVGLNLLYVVPNKVGGTQTYAEGILRSLSEDSSGLEVHVFCSSRYYELLKKTNTVSFFTLLVLILKTAL
ncbi:hypothetical protein H6802_04365 [Candidatus Nomurabacteria bacterium]|uniref:Uncharacterized protein n=1 Tax=candidate division WWE3 bacterium TaxID=2053526 RepID=A0A955E0L1_UNCKA|nr:hypothetical protein [candidate division WWE3 bacterium]MCB9824153.1 hypothetical protein [Candidatus Nomurabacteria bacterium]MCB9826876.1 hypothetical protein [Candidatus Nomurabacteria bacterium]MCB9828094.1 hypothetical protein [Candidatus Nomurabacteria bacterium]HXK52462.1 hypothetical protein [bacterium]